VLTDLDSYTSTRLFIIAARSSLEKTRSYERERTQWSSALRLSSLRHLIHTNSSNSSSNNFSSDEYDDSRVTTDDSIATSSIAHQHSSHFISVSLQRNSINTAYEFSSSQNLQYACQLSVSSNSQKEERNSQFNNSSAVEYINLSSDSESATDTDNYVSWFLESDDVFDAQAHVLAQISDLSSDAEFKTSTDNYISWFLESDDMFKVKASDVNLDAEFEANTNNYVPWFVKSEDMFEVETSSVNSDADLMTGNDNYVSWVSDIKNELAYHMQWFLYHVDNIQKSNKNINLNLQHVLPFWLIEQVHHFKCHSSKVSFFLSTVADLTLWRIFQAFSFFQFTVTICSVSVITLVDKLSFLIETAIQIAFMYLLVASKRSTKTVRSVVVREIYHLISLCCVNARCCLKY